MTVKLRRMLVPVTLVAVSAALLAGCGDGDGTATTTTNEPKATGNGAQPGTSGGQKLEITMSDFAFSPKAATANAGATVIDAPNVGSVEHELVIFKTNMDPAKLPTEANGGVDEEKLDEIAEEAGEIPDVEAGQTKSGDFNLKPGRYVMFCNIPGHYAQGMYGTITVTAGR